MKHLVSVEDLTSEEVWDLLKLADSLKEEWVSGGNKPILAGKTLGMIFQKPSLRTRVSFEVGMSHLGGGALYLSPQEIQLGQRESVADVARVLSRFVDGIMARVFAHADVKALAAHASVPVINGLSDYVHPCQALSDLFTVYEKRGFLEGLTVAYVGDGNNVAHSLLFAASKVGMAIRVSTPAGYGPDEQVVASAQKSARHTGATVVLDPDPQSAVSGVDIVYTDVWASMGEEGERAERLPLFRPYQVNRELVSLAKPDALVMHCLPAHRGEEITDEVIDGPQSIVLDQAENRMHLQKAILVRLMAGDRG
ncbi:MAG TPA: ornithine carbamoyltransferase [Anaerolineae bacterium]|nr:ornithine carbamoyltransferase [Anaerolineae bacterium]